MRRVAHAVLALMLLGAGSLPAQETPPATFGESVVVRVIDVDVVVLDRDGHPVRGLGRDDFELYEDGRRVEISNFLAYEEEASAPATTVTLEPAPATGAAAPPAPPMPAAPPPVTWVVYVDQARVDPGPRSDAIRQIDAFLEQGLRRGDRILVATFDGAALRILCRLTDDRSLVRQALDKLRRQRGFANQLEIQRSFLQRNMMQIDSGSRFGADEALDALQEIDRLADQEAVAARRGVDAARDLFAILAGVEGRVAFVWAGAGIDDRPAEQMYQQWETRFGSSFRNQADRELDKNRLDVQREYARLMHAANSGRFTLFTIQVGQHRGPDISSETPGALGGVVVPGTDTTDLREGSSMLALATATGGRSFVASSGLTTRLDAARSDLATYYSLGYHPTGEEAGRARKLDVRLRLPGLRALHRAEVTDRTWQEQAASSTISALVDDAEPENLFDIALVVGPQPEEKKRGGAVRMPIVVRVPLQQLTLLPDGDQHKVDLWFEFALQDPDGGYRRLDSRPLTFQVPRAKLKEALAQYVSFRVDLDMAPGRYRFATTVLDQLSGVRSTLRVPINVPRG